MPNKLTDLEIIKALNGCYHHNNIIVRKVNTRGEFNATIESVSEITLGDIVAVINRLQAENDRLKEHQKDGFFNLLGNCLVFSKTLKDYNDMRKGLKAEARKEFAERLKKEAFKINYCGSSYNVVDTDDIDNILKEMVGDT